MIKMSNPYNFTQGNDIIGIGIGNESFQDMTYTFTVNLELITIILIIIMFCEIARTAFLFLRYIGLIKKD